MTLQVTETLSQLSYRPAGGVYGNTSTLYVTYDITITDPEHDEPYYPSSSMFSYELNANSDFTNQESIIRNIANTVFNLT